MSQEIEAPQLESFFQPTCVAVAVAVAVRVPSDDHGGANLPFSVVIKSL